MCCSRLAENTGRKNVAKNRHLGTIAQLSSQLRHVSTIGKTNLLSSNISSTCPYNMVNFGPLAAEILSLVWGTPANFISDYSAPLILLWSPYGIGQTIIFSSCGFFPSSSFFPRLISCLPYFHTWCGLSANLRCRSETCCTRLAGNAGRKNVAKNRHLGTIAQLCRAISSQLRHVSTIGKKLVKQQYVIHMSSQYDELRPTSG